MISERSKPKSLELQDVLGDGRQCALCAPGSGVGGLGAGLCLQAGAETAIAYPSCLGVRLSNIRGGRLLTGVGGDGGAEGRMGPRAVRHHINGGRSLRPGWRRR